MGSGDESTAMSTTVIAASAGYSVQQVRDLERLGVIPTAVRAANGYRSFTTAHLRALHTYREVALAVGPVEARRTMRQLPLLSPADAAALIGGLHARLTNEREQALAARRALESVRDEAATEAVPIDGDSMTISQLAEALGVRTSTLRFWETCGLVAPERIETAAGTARRYPVAAIREARITAALRAGGYRIPEVQAAIAAIRDLREVSASLTALDLRLASIGERTLALLRGGSGLAELIASRR